MTDEYLSEVIYQLHNGLITSKQIDNTTCQICFFKDVEHWETKCPENSINVAYELLEETVRIRK